MTRAVSPKLVAYATLAAAGLLAAIAARRPELAAITLPFTLLLVTVVHERAPAVDVAVAIDRPRVIEGERLRVHLTVDARERVDQLELTLRLPPGLAADEPTFALALRAGERRELDVEVRCERWGVYGVGDVGLRASDRFGLFTYRQVIARRAALRVYPRHETLRRLVAPTETQPYAGNLVARRAGTGIEFADIRTFQTGDQLRAINWRASARRGSLVVSERHPEQNSDVILFLDTFAELRDRAGSSLDLAVRAASALATRYLSDKNRVGVVGFGGILRWLQPGGGLRQQYQIVEALLQTDIVFSYAWKEASVIPRRTLPPNSLVIALTPLLDARGIQVLFDLRARGYDLAILEISPAVFVAPPRTDAQAVARRLWLLERELLRLRYRRLGVPVAEWRRSAPLQPILEEVTRSRRFGAIAHVS
ncbi:MAG TPA: DUF58 domain-containing protein [Gaiellales bacterium]